MTLGVVTERTTGTEPNHIVEFREGLELLKNKYPDKALLKLRQAFESDKRNPHHISFLGLSIAGSVVTPFCPSSDAVIF
jgi:hypothetical protein